MQQARLPLAGAGRVARRGAGIRHTYFPEVDVNVPVEWLTERVDSAPTSYQDSLPPGAALRLRAAWQRIKFKASEGDEVWAFSSPSGSWGRRPRYTGYALVRGGKVLLSAVVGPD